MKAEEFLKSHPLYSPVDISGEEHFELLYNLRGFNSTIDIYCPACGKESTFKGHTPIPRIDNRQFHNWDQLSRQIPKVKPHFVRAVKHQVYSLSLSCTRNDLHKASYLIRVSETELEKIGQYPSMATLIKPDTQKYKKILTDERMFELNRGIGLYAFDIGIGSFVYLRRVIEFLVEEAHLKAKGEEDWDEEKYFHSKFKERVKILSDHLPEFLVNNTLIHSILSKGIHEWSEDECKMYFNVVRRGINMILNQRLAKKIEEEDKQFISNELQVIYQNTKTDPAGK